MKYSEFERDIEAMGYSISIDLDNLYVKGRERACLISVGTHNAYIINSDYDHFRHLEDSKKEKLLGLVWQLASTPLEERNEEKRYRLRLPFLADHQAYLNEFRNGFFMGDKHQTHKHKTIFTEREVKELKAKHDLDGFVMEEVKDDE